MKKIIASLFFALFACAPAFATTSVFSDCGTGAASGCVVGDDAVGAGTVASPYQTAAKFKAVFLAAAAGDHLQLCQGGAWNSVATGNMKNTNATKTNPIVIESVDCSALWVGGAGIRPKLNSSGSSGVLIFNQFTPVVHVEGYTVKNIEIVGDGSTTSQCMGFTGGGDYVTIDGVKVSGCSVGIQFSLSTATMTSGVSGAINHVVIRNSIITGNRQIGILVSASDLLIEKNTFSLNGQVNTDHQIYVGGGSFYPAVVPIASITGSGITATLATSAPHGIPIGTHMTIGVSGSTSSGSGTFNVTGGVGGTVAIVTGPTTITYPASGTPSASTVGTYAAYVEAPLAEVVIRNNTMTDASVNGAGNCHESHIIFHGATRDIVVEGNNISESIAPTGVGDGSCGGIEIDDGGYSAPEDYNRFNNVVVRGNTVLNTAFGIGLDLAQAALIENNYVYTTFSDYTPVGITMRIKNYAPGTAGTSTLPAHAQSPDNVTIRYNTIYNLNPKTGSWAGIALNGNFGDPLTGRHHNLYGNVVVLGSTATTSSMCFDTENIITAAFDVKDYNACYHLGAAVPKWENTLSLATVQALGLDTHSILAATASVSTGQPFFTAPTTGPNISTSSALKGAGHPSLGPKTGWGGSLRHAAPWDIGSFSFGDALGVVPDSPVRLGN